MQRDEIVVKGAKVHNLQGVGVTLPRNRLICMTGVSGSGKSSLAFDTLYAEGQRRYMESLSIHARQFFNQMPRPEVDSIEGLSPAIAIGQQTTGWNPRSTVGTITGIYDLLRVLFARVGEPFCPKCGQKISSQSQDQIVVTIGEMSKGTALAVLAPVVKGQRGHWKDLFEQLRRDGYMRARVDGHILATDPAPSLERNRRHDIEVVIDRLAAGAGRGRIAEAVEQAIKVGQGQLIVTPMVQRGKSSGTMQNDTPPSKRRLGVAPDSSSSRSTPANTAGVAPEIQSGVEAAAVHRSAGGGTGGTGAAETDPKKDQTLSTLNACSKCGIGLPALSPQLFSFNSPQGMCLECDGLGERHDFDPDLLVAEPDKTLFKGAIPVLRPPIGKWRRHIYRGRSQAVRLRRLDTDGRTCPPRRRRSCCTGRARRRSTWSGRGSGGRGGTARSSTGSSRSCGRSIRRPTAGSPGCSTRSS